MPVSCCANCSGRTQSTRTQPSTDGSSAHRLQFRWLALLFRHEPGSEKECHVDVHRTLVGFWTATQQRGSRTCTRSCRPCCSQEDVTKTLHSLLESHRRPLVGFGTCQRDVCAELGSWGFSWVDWAPSGLCLRPGSQHRSWPGAASVTVGVFGAGRRGVRRRGCESLL